MIRYQKVSPIEIDYFINRFQILQQRVLPDQFGVSEATCDFYGRCEKIIVDGQEKFVVYTSGEEYVPIGFDSDRDFISYFIINAPEEVESPIDATEVTLYCHGNLSNLFPGTSHRADNELRLALKDFVMTQIEPQDFIWMSTIDTELQPFHSFTINFKIVL